MSGLRSAHPIKGQVTFKIFWCFTWIKISHAHEEVKHCRPQVGADRFWVCLSLSLKPTNVKSETKTWLKLRIMSQEHNIYRFLRVFSSNLAFVLSSEKPFLVLCQIYKVKCLRGNHLQYFCRQKLAILCGVVSQCLQYLTGNKPKSQL